MSRDHGQSHAHGEITREHFEQSSWDERYAGEGRTWSGRPNAVLVDGAAERGVADRIEFRQADLRSWTPEGQQWDLVTSCFLHLLDHGMVEATGQMAAAVAPGGTLLVAGHHPEDAHTGLRWSMPGVMFTADELAPAVDPVLFEVRAEARERQETRNDETHSVTDAVLVARRR